jgi:hypothetical protein
MTRCHNKTQKIFDCDLLWYTICTLEENINYYEKNTVLNYFSLYSPFYGM